MPLSFLMKLKNYIVFPSFFKVCLKYPKYYLLFIQISDCIRYEKETFM